MILLKKSNYFIIRDFAIHNNRKEMQGSKLEAFYRLIQKKGEKIECKEDSVLHGINCLEISKGEFVAIKITLINEHSFYPCKLQTYLLQDLSKLI